MQKINKKTKILILITISIIGVIYYYFYNKEKDIEISNINNLEISTSENTIIKNTIEKENTEETIIIYITGEVKNQGIYKLKTGSRIADAIEIAGGTTQEANINKINLAYILEDGMKIEIPNKDENLNEIEDKTTNYVSKNTNGTISSNKETENTENKKTSEKININTATQTELETLPGIGPSTALKICKYREENGKFTSIEDIKNVSGIGDSKYEQIKNLIKT